MEKWTGRRIASVLLVALVVLSAVAMLTTGNTGGAVGRTNSKAATSAADPSVSFQVSLLATVTGNSFFVPSNAIVTLTDTHNPSQTYALNYTTGYSIQGEPSGPLLPGYYEVSAQAPGYFTAYLSTPVRFSDTHTVITPELVLFRVSNTSMETITVFVNSSFLPSGVKGAFVSFVETTVVNSSYGEYNQTVATAYTGTGGTATVQVPSAYSYDIIVSYNNSNSSYTQFMGASYVSIPQSAGSQTINVFLPQAYDIGGLVSSSNGGRITGINAYMLKYASVSMPLQLRLQKAVITAYYYNFYVTPGTYVLALNATGMSTYISNVTVSGDMTMSIVLQPNFENGRPVSRSYINYSSSAADWNYLNITYNQSMDAGTPIAGLPYYQVPDVAMQIALAFNGGYPELNASTVSRARSTIYSLGPEYTTTYSIWNVNSTVYRGNATYSLSVSGIATGSLEATTNYSVVSTDSYVSLSSIPKNGTVYSVYMQANYNTTEMMYYYSIALPPGFELSSNSSSGPYGPATVLGHTVVVVYTTTQGSGYATVSMTVKVGQVPVVKAAVVTGPHAFAYMKNGTIRYYIVRVDTPINFTAQGSYDPAGGPLTYSWYWNSTNSSSMYTNTTDQVVNDTFTAATPKSVYINVTLTATTVTGKKASATIEVKVANDTTLKAVITPVNARLIDGRVYGNQTEPLTFNGLASRASIYPGDDMGIVVSYNFSWGDGPKNYTVISYTSSNLNATHSYYAAGNYTLNLTVTDEVGFTATSSITVQINKTLKPIVSFLVYNSKWKSADGSVQENTSVHFNASATHDPNFPVSSLTFEWNFGDVGNVTNATTKGNPLYEKYLNITGTAGMNVTHIYTHITVSPITVNLTVVDPAGNKASYTYNLTVTSEPRPDLRVINITFSPKVFTQGSAGRITVTIMNVGNANATLPSVKLTAINALSGAKTTIGTISTFYNSTNKTRVTVILPNETVYGSISWSPSSFGNFTVSATTSAALQLTTADNSYTQPVSVNQSQLQVYAFYIGIVVIIIAIIAVIVLRRRMPRRKGYEKGREQKKGK